MDFNGNNILNDVEIGNLTITDKGIIQKEIDEFTDSKELVSKEYVDASGGGGGDVVGPSNSVDNGVCFYDGTTGKLIKEISTIKYNPVPNVLAVPDLSTTTTTSLNTDLQKITNITSAVQLPTEITTLTGELDVAKIKSYEHNAEIQFDNTNLLLSADGNINMTGGSIILSGPVVADTIQCPDINTNSIQSATDLSINSVGNLSMFVSGLINVNSNVINTTSTITTTKPLTLDNQLTTKLQVETLIDDIVPTLVNLTPLEQKTQNQTATAGITNFDGNINMTGTKKITNLAEPTSAQDAATKNYVDGLQPNQPLNTTNNVLFNSVQSTTSINANTVDAITDVTVGVEGVDAVKLTRTLLQFRGDASNTSYGQLQYGDGAVKKTISMSVDKGNFTSASEALIRVDDGYYYFTPTALNMVNKRIASLAEPINTQDATTKNYVDTTNASKYSFRNVNGKTSGAGGVPGGASPNPPVFFQYELAKGAYYVRYASTNAKVVLKSLSDAGTATSADTYNINISDFWDANKFPSVTHEYNTTFVIPLDVRPVFEDPYIRIGWDSPGNDIELTMLQLPGGSTGIYTLSRLISGTTIANPLSVSITAVNVATDIYPAGLNVDNTMLETFINPLSNPTNLYPHYNIQFNRVAGTVFMKLSRWFHQ